MANDPQVPEVNSPARPVGNAKYKWPSNPALFGSRTKRLDGPDKASGRARYSADINRPGMLYGHMLRSPHPHARVVSVDLSVADRKSVV